MTLDVCCSYLLPSSHVSCLIKRGFTYSNTAQLLSDPSHDPSHACSHSILGLEEAIPPTKQSNTQNINAICDIPNSRLTAHYWLGKQAPKLKIN